MLLAVWLVLHIQPRVCSLVFSSVRPLLYRFYTNCISISHPLMSFVQPSLCTRIRLTAASFHASPLLADLCATHFPNATPLSFVGAGRTSRGDYNSYACARNAAEPLSVRENNPADPCSGRSLHWSGTDPVRRVYPASSSNPHG